MSKAHITRWLVNENEQKQRLDNYLQRRMPGHSRSHVYKMIRKGSIRVNGKRAQAKLALQAGDEVSLPFLWQDEALKPVCHADQLESWRQAVLFEDDNCLAINKPLGMPSQPGTGHAFGVADYFSQALACELYLVHRLDRFTSGVMLLAKHAKAARVLGEALAHPQTHKQYDGIVHGAWPPAQQKLCYSLAKVGRKMQVQEQGLACETHVKLVAAQEQASWLRLRLLSGRMHQIRASVAHGGHPLLGDALYGGHDLPGFWHKKHPFLHASRLVLYYQGRSLTIDSPFHPEQLQCLMLLFRQEA